MNNYNYEHIIHLLLTEARLGTVVPWFVSLEQEKH